MPLKLSAIQPPEELREIVLDFGDAGTVEMTVDPSTFTLGRQRAIRRAQDNNDTAGIADALFAVVRSWDLQNDDGEVIPLDESGVDMLTLGTAVLIANKMTEAMGGPKAETPNASPRGSSNRTSRKPK